MAYESGPEGATYTVLDDGPSSRWRVRISYRGTDDPRQAREAVFASAYQAMTGRPAAEFTGPAPQLVRVTYQLNGCTCTRTGDDTRQPHPLTDRCPPCLVEEYTGGTWRPIG